MLTSIKDTLIIDYDFNSELKINRVIKNHSKLIFSDFDWKEYYEDIYIKNKGIYKNTIKIYNYKLYNYKGSKFNQQIAF